MPRNHLPRNKRNKPDLQVDQYGTLVLSASRNHAVDIAFLSGFRDPVELLVYFPLVEKSAKRHEPDLALRSSQKGHPIEDQSGKQLFVACPTNTFFEGSSSLST